MNVELPPDNTEVAMRVGDGVSVSVLIGYFVGALPTIALVLTITYTLLRLWEMKTVQGWRCAIRNLFL